MAKVRFTKSGSVTAASRRASKKAGHTMADGSFPINDAADLARAKHDVGRAHDPGAARAWINKRAKELGKPGLGKKDGGHVDGGWAKHTLARRARGGTAFSAAHKLTGPERGPEPATLRRGGRAKD